MTKHPSPGNGGAEIWRLCTIEQLCGILLGRRPERWAPRTDRPEQSEFLIHLIRLVRLIRELFPRWMPGSQPLPILTEA
jgi:hypothetical protein